MARAVTTPDVGKYSRPGLIQKEAPYLDNGSGGNLNANVWVTARGGTPPLMVLVDSGNFGRGLRRSFQYGQQYPEASHWAEFHYSNSVAIDASMTLLVGTHRFQILGAVDHQYAHIITILALVEWQAKGSV